jgi:hypothetical protein
MLIKKNNKKNKKKKQTGSLVPNDDKGYDCGV